MEAHFFTEGVQFHRTCHGHKIVTWIGASHCWMCSMLLSLICCTCIEAS